MTTTIEGLTERGRAPADAALEFGLHRAKARWSGVRIVHAALDEVPGRAVPRRRRVVALVHLGGAGLG